MAATANPWPYDTTASYANVALYSTTLPRGWPGYQGTTVDESYVWYAVPARWSLDRLSFDRFHLARVRRVSLCEPAAFVAFALERRPLLTRRAPRPAGRPSGWRRARKGGRRT